MQPKVLVSSLIFITSFLNPLDPLHLLLLLSSTAPDKAEYAINVSLKADDATRLKELINRFSNAPNAYLVYELTCGGRAVTPHRIDISSNALPRIGVQVVFWLSPYFFSICEPSLAWRLFFFFRLPRREQWTNFWFFGFSISHRYFNPGCSKQNSSLPSSSMAPGLPSPSLRLLSSSEGYVYTFVLYSLVCVLFYSSPRSLLCSESLKTLQNFCTKNSCFFLVEWARKSLFYLLIKPNHYLLLIMSNLEHGQSQYRRKMEMKVFTSLDAEWCCRGPCFCLRGPIHCFTSILHTMKRSTYRSRVEERRRRQGSNEDKILPVPVVCKTWIPSESSYSALRYIEYQIQCENVHLLTLLKQEKWLTLQCLFCWFCALHVQRVLNTSF